MAISFSADLSEDYQAATLSPDLDASMSAQERLAYLSTGHDFYGVPQMTWHGRALERFDIKQGDRVRETAYTNLHWGCHPHDGNQTIMSSGRTEQNRAEDRGRRETMRLLTRAITRQQAKRNKLIGMAELNADQLAKVEALERDIDAKRAKMATLRKKVAHRSPVDVTLSAPKYVSLLLAMATPEEQTRIAETFRSCVGATLDSVVREYCLSRRTSVDPITGRKIDRPAHADPDGIAVAITLHNDARPTIDPDTGEMRAPMPHLHAHNEFLNLVRREGDDDFHALFTDHLVENLQAIGNEFTARLAQGMRDLGYGVIEDKDSKKIDSFAIVGINPDIVAQVSDRTREIEEYKRNLLDQGRTPEGNEANLKTRQRKNPKWTDEALDEAWRGRMSSLGWNKFVKTDHSAAQVAAGLLGGGGRQAIERDDAQVAADIVRSMMEGASYFSVTDIRKAVWKEIMLNPPKDGDLDARAAHLRDLILRSDDLYRVRIEHDGQTFRRLNVSQNRYGEPVFTSKGALRRERELMDVCGAYISEKCHIDDEERRLRESETNALLAEGGALERQMGFRLNDEQMAMTRTILAEPMRMHLVSAHAGTGKTTTMGAILSGWMGQGRNVILMAPSHAAAGQLRRDALASLIADYRVGGRSDGAIRKDILKRISTGVPDRLCRLMDLRDELLSAGKSDEAEQIDKYLNRTVNSKTTIVIDEASMVGSENLHKIVMLAGRNGAQIILQGDPAQISAVARGAPYADLVREHKERVIMLETIKRQNAEWQREATRLAELGDLREAIELYANPERRMSLMRKRAMERGEVWNPTDEQIADIGRQRVHEHTTRRGMIEHIASGFARDAEVYAKQGGVAAVQAYASLNEDVMALNAAIRARLVEAGHVDAGMTIRTTTPGGRRSINVGAGDRIVLTRKLEGSKPLSQLIPEIGRKMLRGKLPRKADILKPEMLAANSEQGTILQAGLDGSTQYVIVRLDSGETHRIDQDRFNFDHAYAVTAHKSQGATRAKAFIMPSHFGDRATTLVMMSRHKSDMEIVCQSGALGGDAITLEKWIGAVEGASARESVRDLWARGMIECDAAWRQVPDESTDLDPEEWPGTETTAAHIAASMVEHSPAAVARDLKRAGHGALVAKISELAAMGFAERVEAIGAHEPFKEIGLNAEIHRQASERHIRDIIAKNGWSPMRAVEAHAAGRILPEHLVTLTERAQDTPLHIAAREHSATASVARIATEMMSNGLSIATTTNAAGRTALDEALLARAHDNFIALCRIDQTLLTREHVHSMISRKRFDLLNRMMSENLIPREMLTHRPKSETGSAGQTLLELAAQHDCRASALKTYAFGNTVSMVPTIAIPDPPICDKVRRSVQDDASGRVASAISICAATLEALADETTAMKAAENARRAERAVSVWERIHELVTVSGSSPATVDAERELLRIFSGAADGVEFSVAEMLEMHRGSPLAWATSAWAGKLDDKTMPLVMKTLDKWESVNRARAGSGSATTIPTSKSPGILDLGAAGKTGESDKLIQQPGREGLDDKSDEHGAGRATGAGADTAGSVAGGVERVDTDQLRLHGVLSGDMADLAGGHPDGVLRDNAVPDLVGHAGEQGATADCQEVRAATIGPGALEPWEADGNGHLVIRTLFDMHDARCDWLGIPPFRPVHPAVDYEDHLLQAAASGDAASLNEALANGAEGKGRASNGLTPMHLAVQKESVPCISALAMGVPGLLEIQDKEGFLPIHHAVSYHPRDIVALVAGKLGNCLDADSPGGTPLCLAASSGRGDTVGLLLSQGAAPDKTDPFGWTPLMLAAWNGHTDAIERLLNGRALVNVALRNCQENGRMSGMTALHLAAAAGHADIAQKLIAKGSDTEATDSNGHTPLQTALFARPPRPEVVKAIATRTDLKRRDGNGQTPLMLAASMGDVRIVKALYEADPNRINDKDWDKNTSLHHAASAGALEACGFLVRNGATWKAKNSKGLKPIDMAATPEVQRFLASAKVVATSVPHPEP